MTKRVFRVFTMQRYNIAKAHFGLGLVSLRKSWEKVVSVGFVGFRAFIIYILIYIIFVCRLRAELTFLKILIFKINIVPPLGEGDIHYMYK